MTPSSSHDYLTNAAACASFDALTGALAAGGVS
jgi:hypothetical protein